MKRNRRIPWACLLAVSALLAVGWIALAQVRRQRDARWRELETLKDRYRAAVADRRVALEELVASKRSPRNAQGRPFGQTVRGTLEEMQELKRWFAENPEQQIPEFKYLRDSDWFTLLQLRGLPQTTEEFRGFAGAVRAVAMIDFEPYLSRTLRKYVAASGGRLPDDIIQLVPYLPMDLSPAVLSRYRMLVTGATLPNTEVMVIGLSPSAVTDARYDQATLAIGLDGYGNNTRGGLTPEQSFALEQAQSAYAMAHQGRRLERGPGLLPYFTDPALGRLIISGSRRMR